METQSKTENEDREVTRGLMDWIIISPMCVHIYGSSLYLSKNTSISFFKAFTKRRSTFASSKIILSFCCFQQPHWPHPTVHSSSSSQVLEQIWIVFVSFQVISRDQVFDSFFNCLNIRLHKYIPNNRALDREKDRHIM